MAVGLGLLLCEGTLTLACLLFPRLNHRLRPPYTWARVPDPVFGNRMSPYYPGNDAWGFRNSSVPDRCDLLAIGDSNTYGFAAMPEKSWPRQLASITGLSTYNISMGGYGPCEYQALLEKGLSLHPHTVLLGLYVGNDCMDSFLTVYRDKRFLEYQTQDEARRKEICDVRKWRGLHNEFATAVRAAKPPRRNPAISWLWNHSSLFRLGRAFKEQRFALVHEDESFQEALPAASRKPFRATFDADPRLATVFIVSRALAFFVDQREPQIEEGFRITTSILGEMQAKLDKDGIRFIVIVLPTKHLVYKELIKSTKTNMPETYYDGLAAEERLTADIEDFLERQHIEFVNTTRALRSCLVEGRLPYPQSDDGHPNAVGYRAIAEAVAAVCHTRK